MIRTKIFHSLANLDEAAIILSPLAVILMEVCWLYPWLIWLGKWPAFIGQRPSLGLIALIILLGTAYFVTKFFIRQRWPLRRVRLAIIASGVLAIFLAVRVEYGAGFGWLDGRWFLYTGRLLLDSFTHPHPVAIAPLVGVYLWWRGIRWGRSTLYFEDIYRAFLVGLAALVMLLIFWTITAGAYSLGNSASAIGLYVTGFFFFGLAALALHNLKNIQARMKEGPMAFGRRWLLIIVAIIGGIIIVGVAVSAVFSSQVVAFLGVLLNSASDLLLKAFYYLLLPIGLVVQGLVYLGQIIIGWFQHGQPPQPFQSSGPLGPNDLPEIASRTLSPQVVLAMKWGLFVLVTLFVFFLLSRAVFRYWSAQTRDDVEEIHESLWSWDGLMADLRLFFKSFRQRLTPKSKPPLEDTIPDWYRRPDIRERLDIREIYRRLLWEAAHLGLVPRRRDETPLEYSTRLGQAMPGSGEPLSGLTRLYIDVRYGDLQAGDKQIDDANSLWRALKSLLEKEPQTE
ncbi:MAG: DUF4129 domain-containing protein [Chloroflexota bacterium]